MLEWVDTHKKRKWQFAGRRARTLEKLAMIDDPEQSWIGARTVVLAETRGILQPVGLISLRALLVEGGSGSTGTETNSLCDGMGEGRVCSHGTILQSYKN